MSEDWSINKVGSYMLNGTLLKSGIEKLREELIEDFEHNCFCVPGIPGYTESKMVMHIQGIKQIINRKFGVDEK